MKSILCPTDFSDPSEIALEAAARLARHENAELLVLHVTPPLEPVLGIASTLEFEEGVREEITERLCALIEKCVPPDVRASPLVSIGQVVVEIRRAAERQQADAIVIATHGRAGWARLAFGSVADAVMREAACPVFAIGPECAARPRRACLEFPFRQVLCPTDWSAPSERAVEQAFALCRRYNAELLLLHVVEPPCFTVSELEEEPVWRKRHREAKEKFAALRESQPDTRNAHCLVECGDAAQEIARVARGEEADLIVMSTHGASGWANGWRRAFGSVAQKVLGQAACAVLVLPAAPAAAPLPENAGAEAVKAAR